MVQNLSSESSKFQACWLYSASSQAARNKDSKGLNSLGCYSSKQQPALKPTYSVRGTQKHHQTVMWMANWGKNFRKTREKNEVESPGDNWIKPEIMKLECFTNAELPFSVFWQSINNPTPFLSAERTHQSFSSLVPCWMPSPCSSEGHSEDPLFQTDSVQSHADSKYPLC